MSIKLKHSGGNSVSLNAPTSAPTSSEVAFKLPNADGSSGQYMKTDGSGNLAFATISTPVAGITMMDQWSINTDNNKTNAQVIDTGWERADYHFAQIGTGMTESSGVFTFPQTGIYLLMCQHQMNTSASYCGVKLQISSDSGSNWSIVTYGEMTNTNNGYHHLTFHGVVDIQNASTYRARLIADNSANVQYSGDSTALRNGITFIRLGDT